nr:MAG TPA: hypothetical protein [Caudoviricetes sp.]
MHRQCTNQGCVLRTNKKPKYTIASGGHSVKSLQEKSCFYFTS